MERSTTQMILMRYLFYSCLILLVSFGVLCPARSFGELPEGRWVHYERQTPTYNITAIFPGSGADKLWVSTEKALHSFDGTYWKKHVDENKPLRDYTPFFRDDKGRFYFEDGGALLVLENGVVTTYTDVPITFPVVAASKGDGIIYLGLYDSITGGLYTFNGSSVRKIRGGRVRSIVFDHDGRLWATIVDPNKPIALMVQERDEWSDRSGEIASILPTKANELTVQVAPDGAVWVNNLGKYGVYRNGTWSFHDGGSGPMFLSFDGSGGVWGYRNGTIYHLNESGAWTLSLIMDPGMLNLPNFLTEDAEGVVWTFNANTIRYYKNGAWTQFENNLDLASDRVTCMVYTKDGKLMCGHGVYVEPLTERKNEGISVWDGKSWYNFNKSGDEYLYNVYLLKRSPYDEIIASTDAGLKVYDGFSWSTIDTLEAVVGADIVWDKGNIMWVASYTGLFEYDYPRVDFKVEPIELYPNKVFYNLNFALDGVLYMQTNYGAIWSYSEDRDKVWISHPSSTNFNADIAVDSNGILWCARTYNLSWWDEYSGWRDAAELYGGRMVEIDEEGRIWASGYGTTGYYENNVWNPIPELSRYAADRFIFDSEGRYALNAFEVDMNADPPERINFAGVFEYIPGEVGVENDHTPQPFIPAINYPNPFNPSTTISFTIPKPEQVTITVYSLLGQKVATLASEWFPAGKNRVIWNSLTDLGYPCASGVYLYRIVAGNAVKTGKMLLVR